jgi:hypothetical protein
LQSEETEVDPALRAAAGMTDDDDENQQHQHQSVKRISQPIDIMVIEADGDKHRDQAKSEPRELTHRQSAGMTGNDIVISAINCRDADGDKREDQKKKRPVEVRDQAPVNLHGFLPAPAHAAFRSLVFAVR